MIEHPSRIAAVLSLCACAALAAPAAADESARSILAKVDSALFLEAYSFAMTMETVEPGAAPRSMSFEGVSRKDTGSYFEVTAPARTAGTRFLQLEGSLWMFNPKSGSSKALRLSARDSFQGSSFSNADVGKSQYSDDYEPAMEADETLDLPGSGPAPCWRIASAARTPDAAYGKITMWIRKSDSMPVRMEYYARSGLLYKRMDLSRVTRFGSFTRPAVMRMESLEKKGSYTVMTIRSFEAKDVPESSFNKNHLTR